MNGFPLPFSIMYVAFVQMAGMTQLVVHAHACAWCMCMYVSCMAVPVPVSARLTPQSALGWQLVVGDTHSRWGLALVVALVVALAGTMTISYTRYTFLYLSLFEISLDFVFASAFIARIYFQNITSLSSDGCRQVNTDCHGRYGPTIGWELSRGSLTVLPGSN